MNCTEARELMLEAELGELRGEGDGALARHVAACAACAVAARLVLNATHSLDAALATMATQPVSQRAQRPQRRPRVARRAIQVGLAAAAVIATILVVRRDPGRGFPPGAPEEHASPPLPRGVEVDFAASPRTAAVFATADPTITVVWYF